MGTNQKRRRRNVKQIILLLLVLVAIVVAVDYWLGRRAVDQIALIRFKTSSGTLSPLYSLETATDYPTRAKGLMFRKELAAKQGMLFCFPETRIQSFWMKDTYLTLDIIFLNEELEVVGLLEQVPPLNLERREIDSPSRLVVEVLGGTVAQLGIVVGDKLVPERPLPTGCQID